MLGRLGRREHIDGCLGLRKRANSFQIDSTFCHGGPLDPTLFKGIARLEGLLGLLIRVWHVPETWLGPNRSVLGEDRGHLLALLLPRAVAPA